VVKIAIEPAPGVGKVPTISRVPRAWKSAVASTMGGEVGRRSGGDVVGGVIEDTYFTADPFVVIT